MRVVLEIKEEKHQIKSLRKMLAGDDEMEFVELSMHGTYLVTKKCDTILEIIADEKRLEEERDQASQLRNRIKGTGNSRGYGGYGGYGSESYDAVGSDSRKKRQNDDPYRGYGANSYGNRDRDRERERDRDRDYGGSSNTGGRYDAHQGGSNLMKKLGIASEPAKPEEKDDDIEFPEDDKPSKITAPPKKEETKPAPAFVKPTTGAKFLPPPPSKGGAAPATTTSTSAGTGSSTPANSNDGFDLLGGDLLGVTPAPAPVKPAPQAAPQGSGLLGFDFTSPQTTPTQVQGNQFNLLGGQTQPSVQPTYGGNQSQGNNLLSGGMGNYNGGLGTQAAGNGFGAQNGMGGFGNGLGSMGGGYGGMQQNPSGMGGNFGGMGSFGGQNQGMNSGQNNFGNMGSGMGTGMGFGQPQGSFGMGSSNTQTTYGANTQQNKKLITFDTKTTGGSDLLGGFQDSKPKTIVD